MKIEKEQARIEKAVENGEKLIAEDIITKMLVINKEDKYGKHVKLTMDEMFDEFKYFFIVGMDATSHYLEMMIYYISSNPEIQKKVRQEIADVMKDNDFSPENMKKLKYIEAIQKEATRIYGPIPFVLLREVVADHYLDGIPIKTGTIIQPHMIGINYDEKLF